MQFNNDQEQPPLPPPIEEPLANAILDGPGAHEPIHEPSSNEEYSLAKYVVHRRRIANSPISSYSTFKLTVISLTLCLLLVICNFGFALMLKSMPTQLFLHEHKQLMDDWMTQPFVDIVLESEAAGCPQGYEPLLHRVWNGTYDICEKQQTRGSPVSHVVLKSENDTC